MGKLDALMKIFSSKSSESLDPKKQKHAPRDEESRPQRRFSFRKKSPAKATESTPSGKHEDYNTDSAQPHRQGRRQKSRDPDHRRGGQQQPQQQSHPQKASLDHEAYTDERRSGKRMSFRRKARSADILEDKKTKDSDEKYGFGPENDRGLQHRKKSKNSKNNVKGSEPALPYKGSEPHYKYHQLENPEDWQPYTRRSWAAPSREAEKARAREYRYNGEDWRGIQSVEVLNRQYSTDINYNAPLKTDLQQVPNSPRFASHETIHNNVNHHGSSIQIQKPARPAQRTGSVRSTDSGFASNRPVLQQPDAQSMASGHSYVVWSPKQPGDFGVETVNPVGEYDYSRQTSVAGGRPMSVIKEDTEANQLALYPEKYLHKEINYPGWGVYQQAPQSPNRLYPAQHQHQHPQQQQQHHHWQNTYGTDAAPDMLGEGGQGATHMFQVGPPRSPQTNNKNSVSSTGVHDNSNSGSPSDSLTTTTTSSPRKQVYAAGRRRSTDIEEEKIQQILRDVHVLERLGNMGRHRKSVDFTNGTKFQPQGGIPRVESAKSMDSLNDGKTRSEDNLSTVDNTPTVDNTLNRGRESWKSLESILNQSKRERKSRDNSVEARTPRKSKDNLTEAKKLSGARSADSLLDRPPTRRVDSLGDLRPERSAGTTTPLKETTKKKKVPTATLR